MFKKSSPKIAQGESHLWRAKSPRSRLVVLSGDRDSQSLAVVGGRNSWLSGFVECVCWSPVGPPGVAPKLVGVTECVAGVPWEVVPKTDDALFGHKRERCAGAKRPLCINNLDVWRAGKTACFLELLVLHFLCYYRRLSPVDSVFRVSPCICVFPTSD